MNGIVREQISGFDIRNGGGIISDKIRIENIDNPVLIIGIGGTGIDALLRLKYQINRRFKLPEDEITKTKKETPEGIEFLGFETNAYEKNKSFRGIKLDPQSELVLLSNSQIGSILNNREILDDCIKEWLSPELNIADGMQGANGNRQAGRLLLFTKINDVVESIRKKIWKVMLNTNEKLEVFILTGISGGTGSGAFLDIAYIVRGLIEEKFGDGGIDRVNILAYLFTPDVNLSKNPEINARSYIIKNGYSALKEVDYLMSIPERGDSFVQNYKNFKVASKLAPFDVCHLVSATNKQGKILKNGYEYCMNVTAEIITNFISNEQRASGQEFAIQDWLSNVPMLTNQMPKPYRANYKYVIIGASAAVLPIEDITTFIAAKLFEKMESMFEKAPLEQEVNQFIKTLRLDIDAVEARFENGLTGKQPLSGFMNREKFSYDNVIKKQSVNIDEELSGYLREAAYEYTRVKKQYPKEVSALAKEQIERLFKDQSKGPFYASRMLCSNTGFDTIKTLEAIIEVLDRRRKNFPERIKSFKEDADEKLSEARKVLLTKEAKKNIYIKAKIDQYKVAADAEKNERMIQFYHDVIGLIAEQNNEIYKVYTEILNELNKIFIEDADILVKTTEDSNKDGSKTYYWNVVEVPEIAHAIEEIIDKKNTDDIIRSFTSRLLEQSKKWLKEDETDVAGEITKFVSEQFDDIITNSMEDFILMKYGGDKAIEDYIRNVIAPKLEEEAVPVFQLNDAGRGFTFPSWDMVSIPLKTPKIKKGIEQYKEASTHGSQVNIRQSIVTNRIFWLNTEVGVPLYSYAPIKQYEEEYEKTILKSEGIGRHLVQNRDNNWTYLPSPIPEKSWGSVYSNSRVREYNKKVKELFYTAVKYGIIVKTDSQLSSKYKCIITKPVNIDKITGKYNLGLHTGQEPDLREIKKCIEELRKIIHEKTFEPVDFSDSQKYYIFDSRDEENAVEGFINSFRLIKLVRQEVKKYSSVEQLISELHKHIESLENRKTEINAFLQVLYTDTIRKIGMVYAYDNEEGEKRNIEPFINIMKQNEYAEFYVFKKYGQLEAKNKAIINIKADNRFNKLAVDEIGTQLIYKKLVKMEKNFNKNIARLEYGRFELEAGEEIYKFYLTMLEKTEELKNNLELRVN